MIDIIFQIPAAANFQSQPITFPAIPRQGEQIFLSDFISESEADAIFEKNPDLYIDSLLVQYVTWFKGGEDEDIYLIIVLGL